MDHGYQKEKKANKSMKNILQNRLILLSLLFSLVILVLGMFFSTFFVKNLQALNSKLLSVFTDYYLWLGLLIVLMTLLVVFLPVSKVQLGKIKPEYSYFSWIALLYSTGMGSGILLRAVQEPIYYLQNPPVNGANPQILSLQYTFFHWGFTPWAMYSLFGLIVAYNLYHLKAQNIVVALIPSQKSYLKFAGLLFILLITITGVIASLGLGTAQFVSGLNQYFNLNLGTTILLFTVLTIGVIATLSALTGIHKVIKFLADFDLTFSLILMVFVAIFLNLSTYFTTTFAALGSYVINFFEMSLVINAYKTSTKFTREWTVFYWAFWLSWVPFTGIFIARISKGRTVREFIIATVLVPALATIVWFSVFANNAFELVRTGDQTKFNNLFTSLFVFLQNLPLSVLTIPLAALLVLVSIINSVDSAIFVLGMLSDNGNLNPTKRHKLVWGCIITATALGLTAVGTTDLLNALSNLLIVMALPFSFYYVIICGVFLKNIFTKKAS